MLDLLVKDERCNLDELRAADILTADRFRAPVEKDASSESSSFKPHVLPNEIQQRVKAECNKRGIPSFDVTSEMRTPREVILEAIRDPIVRFFPC